MANFLKPNVVAQLREAFASGLSIRQAARAVGVCKLTSMKYFQLWGHRVCACGADGGHNGWCWWRYRHSPARQKFIAQWNRRGTANPWKFKPGPVARDPLMDLIRLCVPEGLPLQVREEVYQDIAVAVLSGDLQKEEIATETRRFVQAVFRRYPTKWGPRSLDQPVGNGEDRRPLINKIAGCW